MAFNESIKLKVKELAAFQCCRCRTTGVDVHHIIPQAEGGSDDIDNAAPLCPNCHDFFGANPVKQKEIKQMRDWWYKTVKEMYAPKYCDELKTINNTINELRESDHNNTQKLSELKNALKDYTDKIINSITLDSAAGTASYFTSIPSLHLTDAKYLKRGPIRHNTLPLTFENRIKVVHNTLSEVFKVSTEEMLDNFKRDLHPEREIEIWEKIAAIYISTTHNNNWDFGKKLETLQILIQISTGPLFDQWIRNLKYLSRDDIDELVNKWVINTDKTQQP